MKHKYMTQDTCLILFNVWLAADTICAALGQLIWIIMSSVMLLVCTIELLKASREDSKHAQKCGLDINPN